MRTVLTFLAALIAVVMATALGLLLTFIAFGEGGVKVGWETVVNVAVVALPPGFFAGLILARRWSWAIIAAVASAIGSALVVGLGLGLGFNEGELWWPIFVPPLIALLVGGVGRRSTISHRGDRPADGW